MIRMKNVSNKFVEKIKHNFLLNNVFQKFCRLWDNVEKYCKVGQGIGNNVAHGDCILNT
jgi:hypothetical protein